MAVNARPGPKVIHSFININCIKIAGDEKQLCKLTMCFGLYTLSSGRNELIHKLLCIRCHIYTVCKSLTDILLV
jgi:hypothetical protein